jgi:hypothetical protein
MRTDPDPDCDLCAGSGVVATDEDDGEGHTARGVSDDRPCLCTKVQQDLGRGEVITYRGVRTGDSVVFSKAVVRKTNERPPENQ